MKIKSLLAVLILAISTFTAYATDEAQWLEDAKKDVEREKNIPSNKQPVPLPADKPETTPILPVDEKPQVEKSVAEIVAFTEANPNERVAIVLDAKDSEQALLITRTLIAKFPNQAAAIKAQFATAYANSSEYAEAINAKVLHADVTINPTQNTVNTIQDLASQRKISQKLANLLIVVIGFESGDSIIAPPRIIQP